LLHHNLNFPNRRMRTRMSGWCGRGVADEPLPPIPIMNGGKEEFGNSACAVETLPAPSMRREYADKHWTSVVKNSTRPCLAGDLVGEIRRETRLVFGGGPTLP